MAAHRLSAATAELTTEREVSTWIGPREEGAPFHARLPAVESSETSVTQARSIITTETNPDLNTF